MATTAEDMYVEEGKIRMSEGGKKGKRGNKKEEK